MPIHQLTRGDPLNLTLAADMRLSQPDFVNDQIWELRMQGGEPPAVLLQTSFGLRARWMRIFPRFTRKDKTYFDPAQFHTAPHIQAVYPNYIRLTCAPFNGLDVQIEYWAVSSQVITCRTLVKNTSILKEQIRLEWAAVLSPLDDGVGMAPVTSFNTCYLAGRSAEVVPVLVMDGCAAGSGSYPALIQEIDLYPGNAHTAVWVCATLDQEETALELAQKHLTLNWEGQIARIETQNASQIIDIHTGREDWDTAFYLTQTAAANLFLPGGEALPHASFVLARQPDHGYSFRGDGSDYSALWKGQSALDAYYLASLLLPGWGEPMRGVLENFLATQNETGRIDWRPNLAGQRSRQLAQPVLATLALQLSACLPDPVAWLSKVYPTLLRFVQAWFQPEMDHDGDGYPEWEHPQQTGLEDLPLYNLWHPTAQGVEIGLLEAPALAAFLFRECHSLVQIARQTGLTDAIPWLEERQVGLSAALEASWDARAGLYHYRDAVSHQTQEGGVIKAWQGDGKYPIRRTFKVPQRLLLQFVPIEETTHIVSVRLTGQGAEGEVVEEITPRQWTWVMRQARATSQTLFKSLTQIEIRGAHPQDSFTLKRVDHSQGDISLFLPLWAKIPSAAQAKKMVEGIFTRDFRRPFGAPVFSIEGSTANPTGLNGVSALWVSLVAEGLLAYGFRAQAVELFSHTMDGVVGSLKRFHSFREFYDADSGQPIGEPGHLRGFAPLGLFLKLAGIDKLSTKEIIIREFNPFPFTITVKYRGMNIVCHSADTVVTFPTGQSARISGPGSHRITLD